MNQLLARRRRLMSMAQPEDPYLTQPFTMVFQVNRSITLSGANDSNYTALTSLKYNKNNTGWVNVDLSSSRTLSFSTGDSVQWIGNGAWRVDDSGNGFRISGSFLSSVGNKGICSLEGNLLSLFGGDNFTSMTSIPDYALYGGLELFTDKVVGNYSYFVGDITNLRIPATTIGNYSLYCVFYMECMKQGDATNLFPNLTTVGNYGLYMAFGVDSKAYSFSNEFKPPILKATTLGEGAYECMFHYSTFMTTAPSLPATTLADYCYRRMFYSCTSLTTAPSLPATTLASRCYTEMFFGCTKLTTAPTTLPATTLADYCYQGMFNGCTKLTTAPTTLPATTLAYACYDRMYYNTNFLPDTTNIDFTSQSTVQNGYLIGLFAGTKITDSQLRNILPLSNGRVCLPVTGLSNYCYQSMFNGCTALTIAPDLPATTLADYCYQNMFQGCTALTTPPTLPATTLANYCYYRMFYGCTSLTTAPTTLPATTLTNYCYSNMFQNCTALTTPPTLSATTLAASCYMSMFQGCTALVTAPALPATTLASRCYGDMFNGCTKLTTAPTTLPATTLAANCYDKMFYGCTKLTTPPTLPATTLVTQCYNYMFYNCKALTTAPELPATTLVSHCYRYMFQGCSNLNYIKAMFTTTPGTGYTQSWVSGVASSGTFVKNSAATWDVSGVNGVPSNWTIQTASS